MAVKTTFELFDIIYSDTMMSAITALDINGDDVTISDSETTTRYIKRKYSERRYALLTGGRPATANEAAGAFIADFQMFLNNREHNINRMYQALFDYDYSPIENVDRYENEETRFGRTDTKSGTDTTQYGKMDTLSGTDTTQFGKVDTLSGTDTLAISGKETDTRTGSETLTMAGSETNTRSGKENVTDSGSETHEFQKAGFNSPNTYTPDTKETISYTNRDKETNYTNLTDTKAFNGRTDTTAYNNLKDEKEFTNRQDATTYGKKNTESGSDSVTYGKKNTESGSDSITYGGKNTAGGKDERELHVHGNIGVTTNATLINEELNLRMKSLAEMIIDNFINDFTFYA